MLKIRFEWEIFIEIVLVKVMRALFRKFVLLYIQLRLLGWNWRNMWFHTEKSFRQRLVHMIMCQYVQCHLYNHLGELQALVGIFEVEGSRSFHLRMIWG